MAAAHVYAWQSIIIFACFFFIFFRTPFSETTERNSTKPYHMFRSEPGLKINVQNFGSPLKCVRKTAYFGSFYDNLVTQARKSPERNETRYWQTKKR